MRNSPPVNGHRLLTIALAAVMLQGCAALHRPAPAPDDLHADSHLHVANYAMQGVSLKTFIDQYMGDKIARSAVFGLPLQQKWNRFEHFAGDRMPPNYYLGPKAGMYYYAFIDAMVATDFLKLSAADQARLDPMIVGFNPMDQYGVQHVQRMLLIYPGVFAGIGEFSVHKEVVAHKTADDTVKSMLGPGEPLPPDVTEASRNTLFNPALKTLLDFAAESGLIVNLHSDVYPAAVTHDGQLVSATPDAPYTAGMTHLCAQSPQVTVYWAHTGLGRFVKPSPKHLQQVSEVLEACPNWHVDLSWDLVQTHMVAPQSGMPSLTEWARFVTRYQDRVLWGSDAVLYTKNKIDDQGKVAMGTPMPVAEYLAIKDILTPLWDAVGPDVARKVRIDNHARLFDAAKARVRAWEAAHAKDDPWNLPPR